MLVRTFRIQNGVVDWDEENLDEDGEDYPLDAAGGDSDDSLEGLLTSRQAACLNKILMSAPIRSNNSCLRYNNLM